MRAIDKAARKDRKRNKSRRVAWNRKCVCGHERSHHRCADLVRGKFRMVNSGCWVWYGWPGYEKQTEREGKVDGQACGCTRFRPARRSKMNQRGSTNDQVATT